MSFHADIWPLEMGGGIVEGVLGTTSKGKTTKRTSTGMSIGQHPNNKVLSFTGIHRSIGCMKMPTNNKKEAAILTVHCYTNVIKIEPNRCLHIYSCVVHHYHDCFYSLINKGNIIIYYINIIVINE